MAAVTRALSVRTENFRGNEDVEALRREEDILLYTISLVSNRSLSTFQVYSAFYGFHAGRHVEFRVLDFTHSRVHLTDGENGSTDMRITPKGSQRSFSERMLPPSKHVICWSIMNTMFDRNAFAQLTTFMTDYGVPDVVRYISHNDGSDGEDEGVVARLPKAQSTLAFLTRGLMLEEEFLGACRLYRYGYATFMTVDLHLLPANLRDFFFPFLRWANGAAVTKEQAQPYLQSSCIFLYSCDDQRNFCMVPPKNPHALGKDPDSRVVELPHGTDQPLSYQVEINATGAQVSGPSGLSCLFLRKDHLLPQVFDRLLTRRTSILYRDPSEAPLALKRLFKISDQCRYLGVFQIKEDDKVVHKIAGNYFSEFPKLTLSNTQKPTEDFSHKASHYRYYDFWIGYTLTLHQALSPSQPCRLETWDAIPSAVPVSLEEVPLNTCLRKLGFSIFTPMPGDLLRVRAPVVSALDKTFGNVYAIREMVISYLCFPLDFPTENGPLTETCWFEAASLLASQIQEALVSRK